jgi:hypothetical protein
MMERAPKTEGRRGSQRRLEEGGRYLGTPRNRDFGAPRSEREDVTRSQLRCTPCPGNRVRYTYAFIGLVYFAVDFALANIRALLERRPRPGGLAPRAEPQVAPRGVLPEQLAARRLADERPAEEVVERTPEPSAERIGQGHLLGGDSFHTTGLERPFHDSLGSGHFTYPQHAVVARLDTEARPMY